MMKELTVLCSGSSLQPLENCFFEHHVWSLVILFDRFQFFCCWNPYLSIALDRNMNTIKLMASTNCFESFHRICFFIGLIQIFFFFKMHDKAIKVSTYYIRSIWAGSVNKFQSFLSFRHLTFFALQLRFIQ